MNQWISGGVPAWSGRLPWVKQLSADEARAYSVAGILHGEDGWAPENP